MGLLRFTFVGFPGALVPTFRAVHRVLTADSEMHVRRASERDLSG